MKIIVLLYCLVCISFHLVGQPVNDNCENALDITSIAFNSQFGEDFYAWTDFAGATVDPLNYGSSNCFGHSLTTTPSFPDVWLKSTLNINSTLSQGILFWGEPDTFEIATYYGTCGNLFQSECYTNYDSIMYGIIFSYFPHDSAHSMYFQLKAPRDITPGFQMQFTQVYILSFLYFEYDTPADTNSTTSTNFSLNTKPDIKLFPSPSRDELTIESSDLIERMAIISLTGNIITYEKVNSDKSSIDVSSLSPGMYMLRIETNKGWGVQHFIVTP
jgi:hypothetical protein